MAAHDCVRSAWPLQFRSRRGRLGLAEDSGDHATQTCGHPSTELAAGCGDQQVLVGEGQQQVEPAVVVPLDSDRELAQVGVPGVFERPGKRLPGLGPR